MMSISIIPWKLLEQVKKRKKSDSIFPFFQLSQRKMSHKYFIREHKNTSLQSPLQGSSIEREAEGTNPNKQSNKRKREKHKRLIHNISIVCSIQSPPNSFYELQTKEMDMPCECKLEVLPKGRELLSLIDFQFVNALLKLNRTMLTTQQIKIMLSCTLDIAMEIVVNSVCYSQSCLCLHSAEQKRQQR